MAASDCIFKPLEEASQEARPTVADNELVIFTNPVCPFAQRAMIAAHEKLGDNFRAVKIDLKNRPDWYSEIYAERTVPSLQHGAYVMGDSIPVLDYLEETAYTGRGTALYPEDSNLKQEVKQLMQEFGPHVVRPGYGLLFNQDSSRDADLAAAVLAGARWFSELQSRHPGPFFLGETFSMLDITAVPFFERFQHTLKYYRGVDVMHGAEGLEPLREWFKAVSARESFRVSQKDGDFYIKAYAGGAKEQRTAILHTDTEPQQLVHSSPL